MYIQLLYVYNKGLLCCSFLLIFYYEFYYSFYYKAAENRGKQRTTEDNGTFTEYREKAQKRYVSGLLKWLYYIVHELIIDIGKFSIYLVLFHNIPHFLCFSQSFSYLIINQTAFLFIFFQKSLPMTVIPSSSISARFIRPMLLTDIFIIHSYPILCTLGIF